MWNHGGILKAAGTPLVSLLSNLSLLLSTRLMIYSQQITTLSLSGVIIKSLSLSSLLLGNWLRAVATAVTLLLIPKHKGQTYGRHWKRFGIIGRSSEVIKWKMPFSPSATSSRRLIANSFLVITTFDSYSRSGAT